MSQKSPRNKFGYRAVAGGIPLNRSEHVIGGCRVQFDARSTEQAHDTRSERNIPGEERAARRVAKYRSREREQTSV